MSMKDTIRSVLVHRGEQRTAAQMAAQLRTTKQSVISRISELRDEGYTIYANKRTDTKGRTKTFYRHGTPTRSQLAVGRIVLKLVGMR